MVYIKNFEPTNMIIYSELWFRSLKLFFVEQLLVSSISMTRTDMAPTAIVS